MLIAIDRSSFNYIFKYNSLTISKSQILDLSKEILESETNKNSSFIVSEFDRILPIFELDHEVLLLEVQKSKLEFDGEINLPFGSILKVYPLTERAKNLLSGKLNQSIEISAPIFEGVIEQVKLIRSINSRKLLFNKLTKICLIQENPNPVFSQKVQSIVELLLKSQSVGNSYLANLIQYNYNPNEISSGNIEFLEKIGIIAWITTKSSSDGYTTSNYFKRCEEFKSKINEGNYVAGLKTYLDIIENLSPEFKISHDRIKEINNEDQIEIDLFKVSYYFLAIKTKLNKNNSNLLELFEDLIRDIHADPVTMSHVLYLIAYSFSFEQLYESIHILERSPLLESKTIVKESKTIFSDLENEKIKLKKDEEERIRIEGEKQQKADDEERIRIEDEKQQKADEEDERIRLIKEEYGKEEEDRDRLEEEKPRHTKEGIELENERMSIENQNHESEDKKDEIELGKTVELTIIDNIEISTDDKLNEPELISPTNFESENVIENEGDSAVSEPSANYKNPDIHDLDYNSDKIKDIESQNPVEIIEIKEDNSDQIIPSTNGQNDTESKHLEVTSAASEEKPKKRKISKKQEKEIISSKETSSSLETIPLDNENSENRNSEINIEKESSDESREITVQIFEDEFLMKNFKENQEKLKIWADFIDRVFPDKNEIISFKKLKSKFKIKPYSNEQVLGSPGEIEKIEFFFNKNI